MLLNCKICLFVGLFISQVVAQDDYDVKRGKFPYMAFIYYPHESGSEVSNNRFFRSAILVRLNWLISSAVDTSEEGLTFPKKTMLARTGAIAIDSRISLNEDELEQENEVIQIITPQQQVVEKWWETDISLLKTLGFFKETKAVAPATLPIKSDYADKTCFFLVYAKKVGNATEEKVLIQLFVDLMPADSCKEEVKTTNMACADRSDKNKDAIYAPDFCQGNSGGPIVCEGEVMGLQTYLDKTCRPPFLYQILSAWEKFVTCGIEEKCNEEQCTKLCSTTDKDQQGNNENKVSSTIPKLASEVDSIAQSSEIPLTVDNSPQPHEEIEAIVANESTNIVVTEPSSVASPEQDSNVAESETETLTSISKTEPTTVQSTVSIVQVMTTDGRRTLDSDIDNNRKPVLRPLKKPKKKSSGNKVAPLSFINSFILTAIITYSYY